MKYIEAPNNYNGTEKKLFIAGGISDCPDWQKEYINFFKNKEVAIFNPRRLDFDINDKEVEIEQINWEYKNLEEADIISFWFPKETLCPITLFELGKYSKSSKKILVGVHPEYKRKNDIEIQMKLVRPDLKIVYNLEDLANQVLKILNY